MKSHKVIIYHFLAVSIISLIIIMLIFSIKFSPHSIGLLKSNLVLEKEDLFGLVLFFATIAAALLINVFFRRFWMAFSLLFSIVVTLSPVPIFRLTFFPNDEGLVVKRFYLRGTKHGPNELNPISQANYLFENVFNGSQNIPVICPMTSGFKLGPIGYVSFIYAVKDQSSGAYKLNKDVQFTEVKEFCTQELLQTTIEIDPLLRQFMENFIFNSEVKFNESDLLVAAGLDYSEYSLSPLGRYLLFLKSPEKAQQLEIVFYDHDSQVVNHLGEKYSPYDYLYSIYLCDFEYFRFLKQKGLALPAFIKTGFLKAQSHTGPFIDSRNLFKRFDPQENVGLAEFQLSIAVDITSSKCQNLAKEI